MTVPLSGLFYFLTFQPQVRWHVSLTFDGRPIIRTCSYTPAAPGARSEIWKGGSIPTKKKISRVKSKAIHKFVRSLRKRCDECFWVYRTTWAVSEKRYVRVLFDRWPLKSFFHRRSKLQFDVGVQAKVWNISLRRTTNTQQLKLVKYFIFDSKFSNINQKAKIS